MSDEHAVTNSELADFRSCRMKWYLRNVRELRTPEPEESAAATGTLVHSMIERALLDGDPMAVMQAKVQERGVNRTDADVLRTFRLWETWSPSLYENVEVLATEQTIEARVGTAMVNGKIDVVGTKLGHPIIIDHKTTGKPLSWFLRENELSIMQQLLTYDVLRALSQGNGDQPSIVAVHVISTAGGGVRAESWAISPDARRAHHDDLAVKADEVVRSVDGCLAAADATGTQHLSDRVYRLLATPGSHCGFCDYRDVCLRMLAGQENIENTIVMNYTRVPRLAYRSR